MRCLLLLPVTLWTGFTVAEPGVSDDIGSYPSENARPLMPRMTALDIFLTSALSTTGSMVATASTSTWSTSTRLISTVSGSWVSLDLSVVGSTPVTVPYSSKALLTGTCTVPYFVLSMAPDFAIACAQIGCSNAREDCCAVNVHQNVVFTECPVGYSSTASGCCPSGWTIYFNGFDGQTPCYTNPSITLVPANTPAIADLTLITGLLFAKKLDLAVTVVPKPSASTISRHTSDSRDVAIAVSVVVGSLLLMAGALIFCWRRKRRSMREEENHPTIDHKMPEDMHNSGIANHANGPVPYHTPSGTETTHLQELESPGVISPLHIPSMPMHELQAQPTSEKPIAELDSANSPSGLLARGYSFSGGLEKLSVPGRDGREIPLTPLSSTDD